MALTVKSRAPRSFLNRHRRIALDDEAFVSAGGLGFAARQPDVDVADFVDGETLPDGLDLAEWREDGRQVVGANAKDLHIELFHRVRGVGLGRLQQAISDPTADDERAPAARVYRARNVRRQKGAIPLSSISR